MFASDYHELQAAGERTHPARKKIYLISQHIDRINSGKRHAGLPPGVNTKLDSFQQHSGIKQLTIQLMINGPREAVTDFLHQNIYQHRLLKLLELEEGLRDWSRPFILMIRKHEAQECQ